MRQCMQAAVPAMVVAEAPAQPADEPELNEFLAENPDQGILRIQAFRGNQAIPVENVHVVISRPMDGGNHIFFEGDTDSSGLIDPIPLPGANREQSLHPGALTRLHPMKCGRSTRSFCRRVRRWICIRISKPCSRYSCS